MENGFVNFKVTLQLVNNFKRILGELKLKKYPSSRDITALFKYLETIINMSEEEIKRLSKEFLEVLKHSSKLALSILDRNYFLFNQLSYLMQTIQALSFANLDFIDYDNYTILNYIKKLFVENSLNVNIKKQDNYSEEEKKKESLITIKQFDHFSLISASLIKITFSLSSNLFKDLQRLNNSFLESITLPRFLHIRFPLVFKDNFLIKTVIFHEYSHLIDEHLGLSKELPIDIELYIDKYSPHFNEDFFKSVDLKNIIARWKEEFIADIISAKLVGPASRYCLLFWSFFVDSNKASDSHPPLNLRIKYISRYLDVFDYENTENEKKALKFIDSCFKMPLKTVYKLSYEIFEGSYDIILKIINKNLSKFPEKDLYKFLNKKNQVQQDLLQQLEFGIPIGAYISPDKAKKNKDSISYKKTSIPKMINLLWKYYFKTIFDKTREIDEIYEKIIEIDTRARKSIDIYRGIEEYNLKE